jgi:ABC-type sugar transport system permease subunit
MNTKINKSIYGYIFISPFFISFFVFGLTPILYSLYLSFTKWNGFAEPAFIGLVNYERLITDTLFFKTIGNTLIIWIISIIPQLTIALALAIILNERFLKGRHFFRAVFYFPNIVTPIILGIMFSLLFDWQTGFVNKLLLQIGLVQDPVHWFNSPFFSRLIVGLVVCYQYFGFNMLIFIAGLQSITQDIYEAAEVDGANKLQVIFRIMLPLLKPVLLFTFITSVIGGMQLFDSALMLGNGPENSTMTMVMYLFESSFKNFDYSYGATIAYGIFVIVMFFTLISMWASKMKKREES